MATVCRRCGVMPTHSPIAGLCALCQLQAFAKKYPTQAAQGATKMPTGNVKIWWNVQAQAYNMVTPYDQNFVNTFSLLVPGSDRHWDRDSKTWTFTERFFTPIKDLAEKVFRCTATVVTRDMAEKAAAGAGSSSSSAASSKSNKIDSVMADFVRLLPYTAARKAWLLACTELHPDKGGSLDKMSSLNAAWQRIEKEFFNQG